MRTYGVRCRALSRRSPRTCGRGASRPRSTATRSSRRSSTSCSRRLRRTPSASCVGAASRTRRPLVAPLLRRRTSATLSDMNPKRTLLPLLILAAVPQTALADDSMLDSTFGSGGIAAPVLAGEDEEFEAIAVQPDGKLVAAGRSGGAASADFFVARFRTDGTLDP